MTVSSRQYAAHRKPTTPIIHHTVKAKCRNCHAGQMARPGNVPADAMRSISNDPVQSKIASDANPIFNGANSGSRYINATRSRRSQCSPQIDAASAVPVSMYGLKNGRYAIFDQSRDAHSA